MREKIKAEGRQCTMYTDRAKVSIKVTPKKDPGLVFVVDEAARKSDSGDGVRSTISIRNKSSETFLAFKVKTNNANKFWVEPKCGFISPDATMEIRVELRQEPLEALLSGDCKVDDFSKDKFLIQSVSVLPVEETNEMRGHASLDETPTVVNTIFQQANPKLVLNTKRNVVVKVDRKSDTESADIPIEAPHSGTVLPPVLSSSLPPQTPTSSSPPISPSSSAIPEDDTNRPATATQVEPSVHIPTKDIPPATPAQMTQPAAASLVGRDAGIHALEQQIMAGLPPSRRVREGSAIDDEKRALEDKIVALMAKDAEYQLVIKEKNEENAKLQARLEQADEQLAQSVEAHRDARRENTLLRRAAQQKSLQSSVDDKSSKSNWPNHKKRDVTKPDAWRGTSAESQVLAYIPVVGMWPLNEFRPFVSWSICAILVLVSWLILVNNMFT